ncbi:MAG TPA: PQQ-binding-like beta-propeller repeat protein [Bacillota bacterium]|nr:PQQ-binding-like beta-propeller repeat protein [Bacillota bacterium]
MRTPQRRIPDFKATVLTVALATATWLLGTANVTADDWPQWRGPHRDGKATGFKAPEKWPEQLTQKWKVVVGVGDSSPALVGDKVYVFGRQEADEVVQCLDLATGKAVWENRYPAGHVVTGPPARHPGTRSSPTIADNRLCTLGVGGILSCLDAQTGKVLWRKQSTDDYQGIPYKSDTAMSPLLEDGMCLVHVGGKTNGAIIAFDLASGSAKWKWTGDGPAFSSPVTMTLGSTKQLVTLTAKSVVGLSLAAGKQLWQIPFEAAQGNNTTPIISGPAVIYTGQGKGMFAIRIDGKDGDFTATALWTNKTLGARFTTPVLKDGLLYGYNGHFFCANAQTGATLWEDATNRGNSAALVDAGPVILALTVNSELTAFKASDKDFVQLAHFKVAEAETWAHPIVAGNRVLIRDRESVALWTIE